VEWLHGDDPWVKKAVADYRRRAKKTKVLSADDLLKRMRRFKPVRRPARNPSTSKSAGRILQALPPCVVAAAIRRLVGKSEFDKAEELAMRFHHVAIQWNGYWLRLHCNHLVHMVEQAREKATRLKAKKNRSGL
jgi:hypothetical protein